MAEQIVIKTGEIVQESGQYKPSGGKTEFTFVKGNKVPPNQFGKLPKFTLVDKTKHKSK
jgi:hypothetical protein